MHSHIKLHGWLNVFCLTIVECFWMCFEALLWYVIKQAANPREEVIISNCFSSTSHTPHFFIIRIWNGMASLFKSVSVCEPRLCVSIACFLCADGRADAGYIIFQSAILYNSRGVLSKDRIYFSNPNGSKETNFSKIATSVAHTGRHRKIHIIFNSICLWMEMKCWSKVICTNCIKKRRRVSKNLRILAWAGPFTRPATPPPPSLPPSQGVS